MTNIVFTGAIKAESGLATCPPKASDDKSNDKVSRLPRMSTGPGGSPYFPGAGIRGKLRRAARDVLRETVVQNSSEEKPLTHADHIYLSVGGIKQKGSEGVRSPIEYEKEYNNPLIALFGAMSPIKIPGRIMIGHALVPETNMENTIAHITGLRTDDLNEDIQSMAFIKQEDVEKFLEIKEANRERSKAKQKLKLIQRERSKAIRAHDDVAAKSIQKDLDEMKERIVVLEEKAGEVSAQMPLPGYEMIVPGTLLDHRMVFMKRDFIGADQSAIQLGLFIASLQRFAENPFLGAHLAHGLGITSGAWDVSVGGKKEGSIAIDPFVGLNINSHVCKEALKAWDAFVLSGDAVQFQCPDFGGKK